jgi:hypothetical protein
MRDTNRKSRGAGQGRERGNAILVSVLLIASLGALAAAQVAMVHRNSRASRYFESHADLRKYAESGLQMSLHDMEYEISGDEGIIGTKNWTVGNDHGKDGAASSYDEGEGDGVPTVGEPNVSPVPIGDPALGAGLFVYVTDTAYTNVMRVVSTATNAEATATIDTYVKRIPRTIPRVGAVFVDPSVVLDLKGSSFTIDGNDYDLSGKVNTSLPAEYGLVTGEGSIPGENMTNLLAQVPLGAYDQVIGEGGMPSISETDGVDVNDMFDQWKAIQTQEVAAGTYDTALLGSQSDLQVTYVPGDLHLTGSITGGGVLLIDGSLTLTGEFTYWGLVIVRGDVRMAGGGGTKHIYGSLMVGQSMTAIEEDVTITGTADLLYSSEMLARLDDLQRAEFEVAYYKDR